MILLERFSHLRTGQLVISDHSPLLPLPVVRDLCGRLSLASFSPEYTHIPTRILEPIRNVPRSVKVLLTNTMSAWTLSIAFCSKLVALIASSADPPPNWSRSTSRPPIAWPRTIWMLAMFWIMDSVNLAILVNIDMLLELLKGVLGTIGKRMQTRVHVIGGQMAAGHHVV